MRIVCDNCSAKYQISDDKVRNKVFKIRCKKCSHVIVVNGKADAEEGSAAPAASQPAPEEKRAAQQPAASAAGVWYVVVNREQVGPLTPEEVQARVDAGDVSADTFGWREGMGDWTRLGSIPEFSGLFSAAPAAGASPFAGGVEDDVMASDNADGGEPAAAAGASAAPASAAMAATQALPTTDDQEDDASGQGPRVEGSLRQQRNENSVLFSLDMLQESASGRRPAAAAPAAAPAPAPSSSAAPAPMAAAPAAAAGATTAAGGASGLIDISAMMGGGAPAPSGAAPASAAPSAAVPGFSSPPGAVAPLVAQRKSGGAKWVAIAAGLLVLLGGGAFAMYELVLKKDEPVNPPANVAQKAEVQPKTVQVAGGGAPVKQPAKAESPEKAPTPSEQPSGEGDEKGTTLAANAAEAAQKQPEKEDPPEEVTQNDPPKKRSSSRRSSKRRRSSSSSKPQAEDRPAERVAAAPTPAPAPPKPARRAAKRPAKDDGELDDLLGSLDNPGKASTARSARRPSAPSRPKPPAADPLLPEKLSKSDILKVVNKNASRVKSCSARQPGASGVVKVSLRISRDGRVSSADIKGGEFKGTPVGDCVERTVRAFQFPAFSGPPIPVSLPFRL